MPCSIELKKAEMLDVPAEKERINLEIEKLNRERVEIAVKIQADVKVLYCVCKVFLNAAIESTGHIFL